MQYENEGEWIEARGEEMHAYFKDASVRAFVLVYSGGPALEPEDICSWSLRVKQWSILGLRGFPSCCCGFGESGAAEFVARAVWSLRGDDQACTGFRVM